MFCIKLTRRTLEEQIELAEETINDKDNEISRLTESFSELKKSSEEKSAEMMVIILLLYYFAIFCAEKTS